MPDWKSRDSLPTLPAHFHFTPEFQLLAACSWVAPPSMEKARSLKMASLCDQEMNWTEFVRLVNRHSVSPLVYAALTRSGEVKIPHETLENLRIWNGEVRRRALLQTAELVSLMEIFSAQNIDVLPWKGVFLSYQLYGDAGLRSSSDIDILVRPEQVGQAQKILFSQGYLHDDWLGYSLTPSQKRFFIESLETHHFAFQHPETRLELELHQKLALPLLQKDMDLLWNCTKRVHWQGVSLPCLDENALLLMLCLHGGIHYWCCLKWLSDVARLLTMENSKDWTRLLAMADRLALKRPLAQGALLSHWIYDIEPPIELCNLIKKEKAAMELSVKALTVMQEKMIETQVPMYQLRLIWHIKKLQPSSSLIKLIKSLLMSPEDCKTLPLPDSLFWLYYPLRPFLWFRRHYLRN